MSTEPTIFLIDAGFVGYCYAYTSPELAEKHKQYYNSGDPSEDIAIVEVPIRGQPSPAWKSDRSIYIIRDRASDRVKYVTYSWKVACDATDKDMSLRLDQNSGILDAFVITLSKNIAFFSGIKYVGREHLINFESPRMTEEEWRESFTDMSTQFEKIFAFNIAASRDQKAIPRIEEVAEKWPTMPILRRLDLS